MVAGVTLLSLFSYGVLSLGSFGLLCVCLFFVYVDGRVLDLTGHGPDFASEVAPIPVGSCGWAWFKNLPGNSG